MGEVGALGGVSSHAVRPSLAAQRPLETVPETARHESVHDRVHRAETQKRVCYRAETHRYDTRISHRAEEYKQIPVG